MRVAIADDAVLFREGLARLLVDGGFDLVGQAADGFDTLLVYGDEGLCDHEAEYGVPITPHYCGWVVERPAPAARRRSRTAPR